MITTAIIWLVFGFLIGMYAVFALVYKQITDEFRAEMNEKTMELARGLIKLNEAIEATEGASDAGEAQAKGVAANIAAKGGRTTTDGPQRLGPVSQQKEK